jgi:N-acetylmuramoyl-L-alanine amidase
MVQDYSAANTYTWNSPSAAGTYRLEVDARDASETTSYDVVANSSYMLQAAPACTAAALSTSPPSPGGTGVAVTMTGSSATCPHPVYRFWVRDPGSSRWSIVQDYSAATTHLWTQTYFSGTYALEVDVRDASETTSYDSVANLSYVANGCSGAALSATPASPQAHGTTITLSGSASCPGTATYRFWVRAPGGSWQIVRDYTTGNTFSWTPAAAGTYSLEVDVRDQNAAATYETVANISFTAT